MCPFARSMCACLASSPPSPTTGRMVWSATWHGWEAMPAIGSGWIPVLWCWRRCPASPWPMPMRLPWTTKSMWRGHMTAQRCWHHETMVVAGPAARRTHPGHCAAISVAGTGAAAAFPAGAEDQFCGPEVRYSAIHGADADPGSGLDHIPESARLCTAVFRQSVHRHLLEFGKDGAGDHHLLHSDRVSDGLLHCALTSVDPQCSAAGCDTAVLDLAAVACVRLGGPAAQRRPDQQAAAVHWHHQRAAGNLPDRPGRLYRTCLRVSAVFHSAPVCQSGEAGSSSSGGGL